MNLSALIIFFLAIIESARAWRIDEMFSFATHLIIIISGLMFVFGKGAEK